MGKLFFFFSLSWLHGLTLLPTNSDAVHIKVNNNNNNNNVTINSEVAKVEIKREVPDADTGGTETGLETHDIQGELNCM